MCQGHFQFVSINTFRTSTVNQVGEVGGDDGIDTTVPDLEALPAEKGRTHVKTTLAQGCLRDWLSQRLHAEPDHQTASSRSLLLPMPLLQPCRVSHMDGKSESWPFLPNLTILSPLSLLEAATALRTLQLTTLRWVRAWQPWRLPIWSQMPSWVWRQVGSLPMCPAHLLLRGRGCPGQHTWLCPNDKV